MTTDENNKDIWIKHQVYHSANKDFAASILSLFESRLNNELEEWLRDCIESSEKEMAQCQTEIDKLNDRIIANFSKGNK